MCSWGDGPMFFWSFFWIMNNLIGLLMDYEWIRCVGFDPGQIHNYDWCMMTRGSAAPSKRRWAWIHRSWGLTIGTYPVTLKD